MTKIVKFRCGSISSYFLVASLIYLTMIACNDRELPKDKKLPHEVAAQEVKPQMFSPEAIPLLIKKMEERYCISMRRYQIAFHFHSFASMIRDPGVSFIRQSDDELEEIRKKVNDDFFWVVTATWYAKTDMSFFDGPSPVAYLFRADNLAPIETTAKNVKASNCNELKNNLEVDVNQSLFWYSFHGLWDYFKKAIGRTTNVNYVKIDDGWVFNGSTPLTMAVYYEDFEMVKMLIEKGAIVDEQDIRWAIGGGFTSMLDYLITHAPITWDKYIKDEGHRKGVLAECNRNLIETMNKHGAGIALDPNYEEVCWENKRKMREERIKRLKELTRPKK